MNSLRASLEAVLRKHLRTEYFPLGGTLATAHYFIPPELLNDLLAVIPQPSREALEKIIREEVGGHHHYTCHIFCQAHWKIMGDKIMAWATGQREWTWCECWEDKWKPGLAIPCESLHPPICAQCHRPLYAAPQPGEG